MELQNKNIVYLGEFDISSNQASVLRVLNNSKSIKSIPNYKVRIVGYGNSEYYKIDDFEINNVSRGFSPISKFFHYFFRGISFPLLLNRLDFEINVIVYYGSSTRILLPLLIYCRLKGIKLIVDVVEWYDYSHLPLGKWGPLALDVHFAMTKLIPQTDGIIAISSYLEDYYRTKMKNTFRVPILVDENEIDNLDSENIGFNPKYLHLVYAGYAGKKDLIPNVIRAVDQINKNCKLIEFHIIGMTESDLKKVYQNHISNGVILHGKMTRDKVRSFLQNSDFSVLYRPKERYAMAGFPTKFVESLCIGLPVLANLTSDLKWYLFEGYNGFISDDHSVESIERTIRKALDSDKKDRLKMKENAKKSANQNFGLHNYSSGFRNFFDRLDKRS